MASYKPEAADPSASPQESASISARRLGVDSMYLRYLGEVCDSRPYLDGNSSSPPRPTPRSPSLINLEPPSQDSNGDCEFWKTYLQDYVRQLGVFGKGEDRGDAITTPMEPPRVDRPISRPYVEKAALKTFDPMKVEWRRKDTKPAPLGDMEAGSFPIGPPRITNGSYKGSVSNLENTGAGVLAQDNCALHISKLPLNCTIADLLGAIRRVGKVYASNIRPPTVGFPTPAAKLVFWDRTSVHTFMRLVAEGKFSVLNAIPSVKMNNHRTAPHQASQHSRVLLVTGPEEIVRQDYLENLFRKVFTYDLEAMLTVFRSGGIAQVEIRFSSYRHQASNAYKLIVKACYGQAIWGIQLSRREMELWSRVKCQWGVDPCA
ncbi:hypothetical protein AAE478_007507 [Parahypoxylon ruwenzoriense]